MSLTTDPKDPELGQVIDEKTNTQNKKYLVLSQEEIAKGFVRPVRTKYVHIGRKIKLNGTIEILSEEDKVRFGNQKDYVAFLRYPDSESPIVGRAITQEEVDNNGKIIGGCGVETVMNIMISETYARNPKFYGATYCMGCKKHLPVEEFEWSADGEVVGS